MANPSLIVFGPQTAWPSEELLGSLRTALDNDPRLISFAQAIKQLPRFWQSLSESDPRLSSVPGRQCSYQLQSWIQDAIIPSKPDSASNTWTMPLTIITHIIQYMNLDHGIPHAQILEGVQEGGIQGFCIGLLTAIAVASSANEEEIGQNGGIALRLALCIGAYIDLDEISYGPLDRPQSHVVRWKSANGHDEVLQTLKHHPNSYISVIRDLTDVNVICQRNASDSIINELSSRGMKIKAIDLEGRCHTKVHEDAVNRLLHFCAVNDSLRFPADRKLLAPVRSNSTARILSADAPQEHAIRNIMIDLAQWHLTISAAASQLIMHEAPQVIAFGTIQPVPSSVVRQFGLKVTLAKSSALPQDIAEGLTSLTSSRVPTPPPLTGSRGASSQDRRVAVIGMACKFPGADSLDEFWEMLTSGTSMLAEMPPERFASKGSKRSADKDLRFWGNFVRDIDAFDHRFFKKSSREAASMDPQQRLLLQVAYQAMESSGYFGNLESPAPDDIGCFVGVCANDYNDNIASHPPNAYSSLGSLRAFLTGKISHYFGWTGPSVTYDTACSSSAVAIHSACMALAAGECSQALAGGVSLYTSPYFYENLSAASFLSPTGATKPFDARADGYCRGEGAGLVVLKKLSSAISDGDAILGVIAGSAVNQNANCTNITVPHSGSQISLYQKVSTIASINEIDVSYVEAHGTGTPVGDPIEMESIRQAFGGPQRINTLHVGSVKGNIGHLEGASGVAALIKTLLMMQKKSIPVQANFKTLHPKIRPLETDRMEIPTTTKKWETEMPIACINNYGAAGSNAAMIIVSPPSGTTVQRISNIDRNIPRLRKYPLFISANSTASLASFCRHLLEFLRKNASDLSQDLSSLTFSLASQQNRSLPYTIATAVSTFVELCQELEAARDGSNRSLTALKPPKPIVLVFGGQVSNSIGLSNDFFNSSVVFKHHLDSCDLVLRSAGLNSLYPKIFQANPIDDIVHLHAMLFSLQYSCAKTWIDSGLQVKALLGHSFGQLTALCVSGVLSLEDGLRLISGRASLMEQLWGPEKGSMISIEASISTVTDVVASVLASLPGEKLEIACFNGPNSHVLVGTEVAIQMTQAKLSGQSPGKPIKFRKLSVTHGFHSDFTEPLLAKLTELARGLVFNDPVIPLETCSAGGSWTKIRPEMVAEHTRRPVYFDQAVTRLANQLGACTWLEAGSSSSITGMVRRALESSESPLHTFQSVQLSGSNASDSFTDATVNLWKSGHKVQFWPFSRSQRQDYSCLNLPPYQFEKPRHWLSFIENVPQSETFSRVNEVEEKVQRRLLTFVNFLNQAKTEAEFAVDPLSEEYKLYVSGHAVLAEPLCPAPLYCELMCRAAREMTAFSGPSTQLPCIDNLEIKSPLGLNDRQIKILLTRPDGVLGSWNFEMTSQAPTQDQSRADSVSTHATGRITFETESSLTSNEFSRYERLIGSQRLSDVIDASEAQAMRGVMIYKVFSKVVTYADFYKGVRNISSKDNEVVGQIILPSHQESLLKDTTIGPLAVDNFVQVAGLHLNSFNECGDNEVYVCTSIDRIRPGAKYDPTNVEGTIWTVYSSFTKRGSNSVSNDIFVFDNSNNALAFIILGANFTKVLMRSLAKVLSSANPTHQRPPAQNVSKPITATIDAPVRLSEQSFDASQIGSGDTIADVETKARKAEELPSFAEELRELLSRVTETPADGFADHKTFEDIGIDSLMSTEVMSEVCRHFKLQIPPLDLQSLADIKGLREYLISRGCGMPTSPLHHSKSDSSFSSSPSVAMSTTTSATSVSDQVPAESNVLLRLADILQEHLESDTTMDRKTNLAGAGLDSLLCIEVANDIKKSLDVTVDMSLLNEESTFEDLADMIMAQQTHADHVVRTTEGIVAPLSTAASAGKTGSIAHSSAIPTESSPRSSESNFKPPSAGSESESSSLKNAQQIFEDVRFGYDMYTRQTGFANFWNTVYPVQARLVLAYTVEAFEKLGCKLASIKAGQRIPRVQFLQKHTLLVQQLNNILADGGLVGLDDDNMVRTELPIDNTPSTKILSELLRRFPQHNSEHRLLHITGSKLAECLTGVADPLQLLFRRKEDKDLLEDVYTNGPMYAAITQLLGNFLSKAFLDRKGGAFEILELGGGTGGTTKHIVNFLIRQNVRFKYTFTDISGSLVAAARKKFAATPNMEFMVLDIEKTPQPHLERRFHTVISTNCIHATRNLHTSTTHIRQMLRPDGFVALVEFTRNIFWFDLVFGLLDGWWLFEDGRTHVLANEHFWSHSMKMAGFNYVNWTDGESEEARTLRIIVGFPARAKDVAVIPKPTKRLSPIPMETVVYKTVDRNVLYADIYYPTEVDESKRPIALLIHGGGHVSFTRKEADRRQIKILLDKGFLPVSVDYRFCPEVNLIDGPMTDVRDALSWVRHGLPSLNLQCPGLRIDNKKVAVVGWSTGGTLAMSLAWTPQKYDQRPPDAILAFYPPCDYESSWWTAPIFPKASVSSPDEEYDLLAGIKDQPITSYYPPSNVNVPSMLMTVDDPRWRIILHMNWKAQTLPVLINGLPSKSMALSRGKNLQSYETMPIPSPERIASISPYAQIVRNNYRTPTFLVHGTADDMIPYEEPERVHNALVSRGVPSGLYLLKGAEHLFDTFGTDHLGGGDKAIRAGYDFLSEHI